MSDDPKWLTYEQVIAIHSLQALSTTGPMLSNPVANPITQSLPCLSFPTDCTWDGFKAVRVLFQVRLRRR